MRNVFRPITNERGLSLMNMMVGLGIGAVVMAGFVSAVQVMNRSKKTQDVKMEASLFIDEMTQVLKKPQTCKAHIANGMNSIEPGGVEKPLSVGGVATGGDVAPGIKVTKLAIKTTGSSIAAPGASMKSINARIELQISNTSVNPPQPLRSRFIPIQVYYDAANLIKDCASLDSSAQVCAQLNGVWDAAAPAGLECVPTDKCLFGGAYSPAPMTGTDANGAPNPGYLNTFTGSQGCPTGFSAQQTGSVSVARKASKYKVVIDNYPAFTCVRCQQAVPDQSSAPSVTGAELDAEGNADADASGEAGDNDNYDIQEIWEAITG